MSWISLGPPLANTVPSTSVNFPVTESPQKHGRLASPLRAPHLPFRRISLPTAPSPQHRVSVVSIASFDSLPEDDGDGESPQSGRILARVLEQPNQGRSPSVDPNRRRKRMRDTSVKPLDARQISKRRKIVEEFFDTEKAYMEGLELIYSHFLTPIIGSLDTSEPLLDRSALTSVFSNFIDIWNFHRSFLSALTSLLEPIHTQSTLPTASTSHSPVKENPLPELSPLLLSHFPYLSLYTPFVTAFPATISALNELITPPTANRPSPQYNQRFAAFLNDQEADPSCGKLKLRDWLLTIVQRCPRYLLLLKDLINATSRDDPEHVQLTVVHTLVAKITLSLNTSLHTHAQTMSLLALQRATPNLPFQLIIPGRTLFKRGPLLQIERSGSPLEREFLLFSDCMIWLAPAEGLGQSWDWSWSGSGSNGSGTGASQSHQDTPVGSRIERPPMSRTRSKSDATLSLRQAEVASNDSSRFRENGGDSLPVTPQKKSRGKPAIPIGSPPPVPNMAKRHYSIDDKWTYKGRIELVDIQVIVGSALEDERRFEILSPEGSFVLYANSEGERDEWTSEIRTAKSQLFVSLNITHPNSTLTSSASTNHVRRALQALPYHPDEDRVERVRASTSLDVVSTASHHHGRFKIGKKDREKHGGSERRRKVDHWVPAIWIPDGKATACMRCGRTFGWRRRRHHCRLCGRCVCAACSDRTFFISDSNMKQETKPARACNACYESVFPVVDSDELDTHDEGDVNHENTNASHDADTITSLSGLPSWLSMPALPVQRQPHALMTIDLNSRDSSGDISNISEIVSGTEERERRTRLRVRSHQRLRSYKQIMEDFEEQHRNSGSKDAVAEDGDAGRNFDDQGEYENEDVEDQDHANLWYTPAHSQPSSPMSSPRKQQRREDTARRSKRFSLPAIAVQTTSVTARTSDIPESASVSRQSSSVDLSAGLGRSKRFSLVLSAGGGRNSNVDGSNKASPSNEEGGDTDIPRSVAAARLSELLGRKTKP